MTQLYSVNRNIIGAGLTRLASIGVAIFSVPILLQLLSNEQYGIWVTLTSLLTWVALLDLGVGNSLRNSVASRTTIADELTARQEFSAFFQLLTVIAILSAIAVLSASYFVPLMRENHVTALLLYLPVLLSLPFLLSASVLQGAHRVGLQSLLQSSSSWLFFIFIAICQWAAWSIKLEYLAIAWIVFYSSTLIIMFVLALRTLHLAPHHLFILNLRVIPVQRLSVGISFLILQIAALVLYGLGNALIYIYLGSEEVARYDVINKVFQAGFGFFSVMIGVWWSEIVRLRATNNFLALDRLYRRMLITAFIFSGFAFLVAGLVPWLIHHWTSGQIEVTRREAYSIATLVSIQALAYVGAVVLNAFEKIRIQIKISFFSLVLMMPLTNLMIRAGHGISAVPIAATILTLLPLLVCNMQAWALITKARK